MNTKLTPMLSVRRGSAAIDFYQLAFNANILFRINDEKGAVVAKLEIRGAEFWVADESPEHENYSPESLNGSSVRMVLEVDDPGVVFNRAVKAGATVIYSVQERHGWEIGRVSDPFGHQWEIGKSLEGV